MRANTWWKRRDAEERVLFRDFFFSAWKNISGVNEGIERMSGNERRKYILARIYAKCKTQDARVNVPRECFRRVFVYLLVVTDTHDHLGINYKDKHFCVVLNNLHVMRRDSLYEIIIKCATTLLTSAKWKINSIRQFSPCDQWRSLSDSNSLKRSRNDIRTFGVVFHRSGETFTYLIGRHS